MNKIWIIALREFKIKISTIWFWLSTFLIPVGLLVIIFLPTLFIFFNQDELNLVVISENKAFFETVLTPVNTNLSLSDQSLDQLLEEENYKKQGFDGVLVFPNFNQINKQLTVEYYSQSPLGIGRTEDLINNLETAWLKYNLEEQSLDAMLADNFLSEFNIQSILLGENQTQQNSQIPAIIGGVTGFFVYMAIFAYGFMIITSVVAEKSSKIIEILISSISPKELLFGKILGVGFVAFLQLTIWFVMLSILSFLGFFLFNLNSNPQNISDETEFIQVSSILNDLLEINWFLIISGFLFYFLSGFLFYTSLLAGGASATDNERDAQNLTFPIQLPLIISVLIGNYFLQNPNSPITIFFSIFPFTSPMIMPGRIAFGVPFWELFLSVSIMLLSIWGAIWLAGKIYRIGILSYGNKPSLKDLWHWIFQD